MGFFGRDVEDDGAHSESLARIEAGGIPPKAQERLQRLASDGSLFTSALSVNEFALLNRLGPRPLAQVMGASVIRTGWQYLPPLEPGVTFISSSPYVPTPTGVARQNMYTEASLSQVRNYKWRTEVVCELDVLTAAWNLARRRALSRLVQEALEVGADAVVGVRLRRGEHDLGKRTIEYVVTGTAIRSPTSTGTDSPTLSDLSVQDYWRLHGAGHEPAGLVATTSIVFASPPRSTRLRRLRTTANNQELEELSQGFHLARESVRVNLRGQVGEARGTGAVGVEFSHSVHHERIGLASSVQSSDQRGWHVGRFGVPYRVSGHGDAERSGWVITMHAAGTAVRRREHRHARSESDKDNHADGSQLTDYDPKSLEGIPESGRERLEQNREGLYTSDLSVNEFLLVTEAGFDPVGLVVGSSIFHIGFQVTGPTTSRELDVLSQAMYSARHLAMTRMEEEADQLGADGIVGVRLDIGRYEWGANMAEFIAIGTAVKHRDGVLHRAPNGRPFQSDLSGQEFWTLLRTGHRPGRDGDGQLRLPRRPPRPAADVAQTGRNVELPNFTQALYDARELAMQRMQTEAQELGAEGIVGVSLSETQPRLGEPRDRVLRARHRDRPDRARRARSSPPMPVLDLNDR